MREQFTPPAGPGHHQIESESSAFNEKATDFEVGRGAVSTGWIKASGNDLPPWPEDAGPNLAAGYLDDW